MVLSRPRRRILGIGLVLLLRNVTVAALRRGSAEDSALGDPVAAGGGGAGDGAPEHSTAELRGLVARGSLQADLVRDVLDAVPFRYQVAALGKDVAEVKILGGEGDPGTELVGHAGDISGVQFFPLGDRVLTWSREGRVVISDAFSGEALRVISTSATLTLAHVFEEGDRLVTCNDRNIAVGCTVWRVSSGEVSSYFSRAGVHAVELFPRSRRMLTRGMHAVVWDTDSGEMICEMRGHTSLVYASSIFPDGARVVTGSIDKIAMIWEASRCQTLHRLLHEHSVMGVVALAGEPERVATVALYEGIAVWSAISGEKLRTVGVSNALGRGPTAGTFRAKQIPFAADLVATMSVHGVIVLNISDGEIAHAFTTTPDWTYDFAVAHGGDLIAACGANGVALWDLGSGARLRAFPALGCRSVAVGVGRALDPQGCGRGVSWRELPQAAGAANRPG